MRTKRDCVAYHASRKAIGIHAKVDQRPTGYRHKSTQLLRTRGGDFCRIDRGGRIQGLPDTFLGNAAGECNRLGDLSITFGDLVRVLELNLGFTSIEEWLIDRTFVPQELSISRTLVESMIDLRRTR